jgi:hypothetical protein
MLARLSDPVHDGILFVTFGAYQAADPIALSDMGQRIHDLIFGCAATIEDRPFGFRKRPPASLALVSLGDQLGSCQT